MTFLLTYSKKSILKRIFQKVFPYCMKQHDNWQKSHDTWHCYLKKTARRETFHCYIHHLVHIDPMPLQPFGFLMSIRRKSQRSHIQIQCEMI